MSVKQLTSLTVEKKLFNSPNCEETLEIQFDKHLYIANNKMYIVIQQHSDTIVIVDLTQAKICQDSRSIEDGVWRIVLADCDFIELQSYLCKDPNFLGSDTFQESEQVLGDSKDTLKKPTVKIQLKDTDTFIATKKIQTKIHRSFVIPQNLVSNYFKLNKDGKLTLYLEKIGPEFKEYYQSPCKVICRQMYLRPTDVKPRKDQYGWAEGKM